MNEIVTKKLENIDNLCSKIEGILSKKVIKHISKKSAKNKQQKVEHSTTQRVVSKKQ